MYRASLICAALAINSCNEQQAYNSIEISGTNYRFPKEESSISGMDAPFIQAQYRPENGSYSLSYDSRRQKRRNKNGDLNVYFISNDYEPKSYYEYHKTKIGDVICDPKGVSLNLKFRCGTNFLHRGTV
jgi:hypothetical protein